MKGVMRTQFTRFANCPTKIHVIFLISPISSLETVSTCIQLNLFQATLHSGDMEIAIDRWLLIAE